MANLIAKQYLRVGNMSFNNKMYNSASIFYNSAIKLDKNYAEAYLRRGILKGKKEQFTEAVNDFTSAIELDSSCKEAYLQRGDIYLKQNMYSDALNDIYKAIRIDPDYQPAKELLEKTRLAQQQKCERVSFNDFAKNISNTAYYEHPTAPVKSNMASHILGMGLMN